MRPHSFPRLNSRKREADVVKLTLCRHPVKPNRMREGRGGPHACINTKRLMGVQFEDDCTLGYKPYDVQTVSICAASQ